ncbi:MAG TPA: hypothetical protein VGJ69_02860 [Pyrinomonadaceae bacterium]|jgi:hypothetical protein
MKIVLLILAVLLICVTALVTLVRSSGWNELAKTYSSSSGYFDGQRWSFVSGWMGTKGKLVRFRSCLNVRTNHNGVYLSFFPPFNLVARALFIPWEQIAFTGYQGTLTEYVDFHFREVQSVILRLSKSTASKILASAPRNLPIPNEKENRP